MLDEKLAKVLFERVRVLYLQEKVCQRYAQAHMSWVETAVGFLESRHPVQTGKESLALQPLFPVALQPPFAVALQSLFPVESLVSLVRQRWVAKCSVE